MERAKKKKLSKLSVYSKGTDFEYFDIRNFTLQVVLLDAWFESNERIKRTRGEAQNGMGKTSI